MAVVCNLPLVTSEGSGPTPTVPCVCPEGQKQGVFVPCGEESWVGLSQVLVATVQAFSEWGQQLLENLKLLI